MTAQKMSAQEIIAFIGNAEKKTNVKVTFEGELATAVPASVTKLGNVLFGDWKDIEPLLANLTENKDYVVEQDGRNSAVPLLDKRYLNARIEPRMHERGMKRIQPMFIPKALSNMGAGNIALKIGAQGVCKSVTTACASANDAIGEAFREIKFGMHDVVLAGGAEASITKIGIGGFNALTALSTTEDPERSSIPFDKDRNGFVMGEGSGVLVIESLEHAQKRGANILAEIVGYGSNCDAYHMTTPTPDGSGAAKAIKLAINEAGIKPEDVDYVNAHGTSTPANEKGESGAIVSVLGKEVPVSSTKSFTGHLLGAAGAVEAIATIEAIRHSFVPKTAGTKELSDYIEANVVYGEGQEADIQYAISNTFGFGGHNAVLAFKRWEG